MFTRNEMRSILQWTKSIIQCETDESNRGGSSKEFYKLQAENWKSIDKKIRKRLRKKK